jgi:aspartyl-tRNA(Asn)/glutamyl-tRNA(Gln) amidotransferase subunit B
MSTTAKYIDGSTGPWELVIGLEIHAQIVSQSKLFSGAATAFGADPNTQVSFIDAAFPGMLPVINEVCVKQAVKTGLGLQAQINTFSVFDRKNYFYPDLPAGYQISQFTQPIVGKGHLDIDLDNGETKRIGITRLHLEQDAGKSTHDQSPYASHIDLNRCGVALMEIVTEPDIRSIEEAQAFVKKLRSLLRYLGTCDGNMEQGSLRADVNVSVRKPGAALGTRAEIKNVNSIRFIGQAIEYEARRQIELLESGKEIDQETRLFDANKGATRSMRSKEDAHDYRYFPDPDLPPLLISQEEIEAIRAELPELPDAKKTRFMENFGLSSYEAALLTTEIEIAAFFEETLQHLKGQNLHQAGKMVANWIMGELFAALNRETLSMTASKIKPESLAGLLTLIIKGTISGKIAKDVFTQMWETGKAADVIVREQSLEQVSDDKAILECIDKILQENPAQVEEYKAGKDKVFGFFVGKVMKEMAGKANPALVNDLLKKKLSS